MALVTGFPSAVVVYRVAAYARSPRPAKLADLSQADFAERFSA